MRFLELRRAVGRSLENIPKLNSGISLFRHICLSWYSFQRFFVSDGCIEKVKGQRVA